MERDHGSCDECISISIFVAADSIVIVDVLVCPPLDEDAQQNGNPNDLFKLHVVIGNKR